MLFLLFISDFRVSTPSRFRGFIISDTTVSELQFHDDVRN